MVYKLKTKKSAQDGTTVTLVADTDQESLPKHLAITQAVLTFAAAPPTSMWGSVADDKIKYLITIERMS